MILRDNYTEQHIRELQAASKGDPSLIERTLYAFGLLEALVRVGLDFTFKGGTSLLLLLPEPKRLSTDIDIVVEPNTDIDKYIEKAAQFFPFIAKEEQTRVGHNNIEKRHFKFTYNSPVRKGPLYILLDVLFEENRYERLITRPIENELLLTTGENLTVRLPSVDCILGDKLTAFAPHTTGIPLRSDKDLEVIKQFYDVSTLIDEVESFEDVRRTYFAISEAELNYRGNETTSQQALEDTIQAAACIGSRGRIAPDDFPSYVRGTRDIVNHVYERGYTMEVATTMAPKVIYTAACLLTGHSFERIGDIDALKTESLTQEDMKAMKALRKTRTSAYGYLVLADRLLREHRG